VAFHPAPALGSSPRAPRLRPRREPAPRRAARRRGRAAARRRRARPAADAPGGLRAGRPDGARLLPAGGRLLPPARDRGRGRRRGPHRGQ
ncbi:MAG: hypothetical protein AVDCRST_MAG38-1695, partial [uncultured Solirubrobacteraceae bacterium]